MYGFVSDKVFDPVLKAGVTEIIMGCIFFICFYIYIFIIRTVLVAIRKVVCRPRFLGAAVFSQP